MYIVIPFHNTKNYQLQKNYTNIIYVKNKMNMHNICQNLTAVLLRLETVVMTTDEGGLGYVSGHSLKQIHMSLEMLD